MRAALLPLVLMILGTSGCWAQDFYEPDRAALADPLRGERLFRSNCARSCHPANAFEVKKVKTHRQLVSTVRAYYEQVVGREENYSRQDLYDLSRYLDRKHYRLPAPAPQGGASRP
ncbi:MAG: hypothetical protein VKQ33_02525 [Candidatus Sericytochromatia bacterium]|nr:hypothetical protein [Candidatus Sericytochromatia bacterium]